MLTIETLTPTNQPLQSVIKQPGGHKYLVLTHGDDPVLCNPLRPVPDSDISRSVLTGKELASLLLEWGQAAAQLDSEEMHRQSFAHDFELNEDRDDGSGINCADPFALDDEPEVVA